MRLDRRHDGIYGKLNKYTCRNRHHFPVDEDLPRDEQKKKKEDKPCVPLVVSLS